MRNDKQFLFLRFFTDKQNICIQMKIIFYKTAISCTKKCLGIYRGIIYMKKLNYHFSFGFFFQFFVLFLSVVWIPFSFSTIKKKIVIVIQFISMVYIWGIYKKQWKQFSIYNLNIYPVNWFILLNNNKTRM